MDIKFTGGSEALRTFTSEKFARLEKLANNITNVQVVFKVDKLRYIAEANIHIAHAPVFHAESESENMYKTVDSLVDKLSRQLSKHKEKITDHG